MWHLVLALSVIAYVSVCAASLSMATYEVLCVHIPALEMQSKGTHVRLTRHGQLFWCLTAGRVPCHAWLWRTQGMLAQKLHNHFVLYDACHVLSKYHHWRDPLK